MKRFVAKLLPALIIVILFISMSAKAFLFDDSKENDSKTVAVTVNGAKIYEDKVAKIAKYRYEETVKRKPSYTLKDAREDVTGDLVLTEIFLQEGRKKIVWVDNDEVQDFISENEKRPYDELKNIKDYKGDFDEFERNIKAGMLHLKLAKKECTKNIKPTEEQMKKYYKENIRDFQIETEYRIISIDFGPDKESNDPNLTKDKCRERAENVLKKVLAGIDRGVLGSIMLACETYGSRLTCRGSWPPDPHSVTNLFFLSALRFPGRSHPLCFIADVHSDTMNRSNC